MTMREEFGMGGEKLEDVGDRRTPPGEAEEVEQTWSVDRR